MDVADQPITAVENGDPDVILHPPPKEINGLISETVKEEDQENKVEELVEEIKSFVEETKVDIEGADEYDRVSEVNVTVEKEEQSLDVPIVAPTDREYSAVASTDGEPEVAVKEDKEEEKEVEAASAIVKEQLGEEKSTEAELPVSLDRGVGECQYENQNVESVQYSGGPESAGENQPSEVITTNQFVHHSSWKECCGLFDILRR